MFHTITSTDTFNELRDADTPFVVEFGREGCPFCLETRRAMMKFARKYPKLNVAFVDTDTQELLSGQYVGKVVPLLVVFLAGEKLKKMSGVKNPGDLGEIEKFVDESLP